MSVANSKFLKANKSPSRKVNELDNRGSHFYLALYWAEALAEQSKNTDLKNIFSGLAKTLAENEDKILAELISAQGKPVDIGGYYHPVEEKAVAAMRPSTTFNSAIDSM